MSYLAYEQPGITVILSLTAFVVLLNGVRYIFDRLLYCGLIGEILVGVVWGVPVGGTAWLTRATQETVQAFGYLGLIGLVFEGGLGTDPIQLRKSAGISVAIATVGLAVPIALSFILLKFPFSTDTGTGYPTPLAGFSAGASLCSTSLGTIFSILSSANMLKTRIGVALVGAAMMDDVVGLVMVNIVTTLGAGNSEAWPIARPIVASFGLLLVTLIITPYVLCPTWASLVTFASGNEPADMRSTWKSHITRQMIVARRTPHLDFILSICCLMVYITIALFIDGSVLFAAFLAGGVVNHVWYANSDYTSSRSPTEMFDKYFRSVLDYALVPFFFVGSTPFVLSQ